MQLSTPAHLNINKISREVRGARPQACQRLGPSLTASPLLQLRRADLSALNCLLSIDDDARFVARLAALFPGLPLVANLRCGLWYTPAPDATAYFKARSGPAARRNLHGDDDCLPGKFLRLLEPLKHNQKLQTAEPCLSRRRGAPLARRGH